MAHCLEELANHSGLRSTSPAGQNLLGAMQSFQQLVDAEAERLAKGVNILHFYGVGREDPARYQQFLRRHFRAMPPRTHLCSGLGGPGYARPNRDAPRPCFGS